VLEGHKIIKIGMNFSTEKNKRCIDSIIVDEGNSK